MKCKSKMKAILLQKRLWPAFIAAIFPLITFTFTWIISNRWQQVAIQPISTLFSLCLYLFFALLTALPFWHVYTASTRNEHVRKGFYIAALGGLIADAMIWSTIAYDAYADCAQPLTSDPAGKFLSLLAASFSPLCIWILMQLILIISFPFYNSR